MIASEELLTTAVCEDIKKAAKKVFVWTVNDAAGMKRYRQMGVDGIISDKAKLLSETLRS